MCGGKSTKTKKNTTKMEWHVFVYLGDTFKRMLLAASKKSTKKKRRFSISLKPIFVCFDSASFYSVFSRIFGMNYFHGKLNIEICFRATSQPFAAMRVNENSTLEKQIRLK